MSVGIYDEDLARYHAVPFNLEAMKIASYYKGQNEIVKLTPNFCPEKYSKFFYLKDIADGEYIPNLHKYTNLSYRGIAFTNNKYIPMDIEIEKMKPDTFIYAPYQEKFYGKQNERTGFYSFLNAQHIRLSLNSTEVWKDFYCQFNEVKRNKIIFLHDYDITGIANAKEAILDFREFIRGHNKPAQVASKFPIRVYSGQQFVDWGQAWTHGKYLPIQIFGVIPDSALSEYIANDVRLKNSRTIEYIVTHGCKDDDDFLIRVLPQIFKQVIFLRMNKREFSLRYEENFFSNKVLENTVTLLSTYCSSKVPMERPFHPKDSLYSFCKNLREVKKFKKDKITRGEAREVFQFIREKNYEVFKDFYELHSVVLKGDEFINE